jgi:hypothetical protein
VHYYQELAAPQLVAAFMEDESCLAQLSCKPTLVLSFTTHELSKNNPPPRMYPPNTVVLGAIHSGVQANIHGSVTMEPFIMMASFSPETTHVTPFYTNSRGDWDKSFQWKEKSINFLLSISVVMQL